MDKIISQLKLPFPNFSKAIKWEDGLGFSVLEESDNGKASLYKIGLNPKEIKKDNFLRKLWITVSYGQKTSDGIKLGSDNDITDPVDLEFHDDYLVNTETGELFEKNRKISPNELFRKLEDKHKLPTRTFLGFWLRVRLWFWRIFLPNLIKVIDVVLIIILWIISGEKTKDSIWTRFWGTRIEKSIESIKGTEFLETNKMDFFGYKAKRWSVVFFCALHLTIYIVVFNYFNMHSSLVSKISKDNFLTLCYIVVAFTITEAGIPSLLKFIIEKNTPKILGKISFRRLII